jgi:hypothetical protein
MICSITLTLAMHKNTFNACISPALSTLSMHQQLALLLLLLLLLLACHAWATYLCNCMFPLLLAPPASSCSQA